MREIRDCNVAVVGGAGFLGSHLVHHLIEDRKCKVLIIDDLSSGRLDFIHPDAGLIQHDITGSEEFLVDRFKGNGIDYVFNYAAIPYVPDSYKRPLRVFDVNAFGALKVINAASDAGVKGILQVSSAEVYGKVSDSITGSDPEVKSGVMDSSSWIDPRYRTKDGKIHEDDEVSPFSTYGASKAAIDSLVQIRWKEARSPVIALRQFNCIGERESHPYVVPEIITQLYHRYTLEDPGECMIMKEGISPRNALYLGNNSFRDFMYAGDAVRMATELLERGEFGQVYNLGSEEGIYIYDLAQILSDIIGCGRVVIQKEPSKVRSWELWWLRSSNEKIYRVVSQRPKVSLKEGLQRTVEYYKSNGQKWCWEK